MLSITDLLYSLITGLLSTKVIFAFMAGLIPSLVWMWFWLREDAHPEPKGLILMTFLGGFAAVLVAIYGEGYISSLHFVMPVKYTLWAAVEEVSKFLAVAIIALNTDYNDEPIDAMIYCIVVALGFSALENALFLFEPLAGGQIAQSIMTGNMRFIGATLVHIVSSAMIGFALGYVYFKGYAAKALAIIIGLSAAVTLHAAFNLSIINSDSADTLKAFAWVWGAVVILIVLFEEIKVVHLRTSPNII